jgi:hypothetical protein
MTMKLTTSKLKEESMNKDNNNNSNDDIVLEGEPYCLARTGWQRARISRVEDLGEQSFGYGKFKFFKPYFELEQKDSTGEFITVDKLYKNKATSPALVKLVVATGKSLKKGFKLRDLTDASVMVNVGRRVGSKTKMEYNDITDVRPLNSGGDDKLEITGEDVPI